MLVLLTKRKDLMTKTALHVGKSIHQEEMHINKRESVHKKTIQKISYTISISGICITLLLEADQNSKQ